MKTKVKTPAEIWFSTPSWDTSPKTVEATIKALTALLKWEKATGDKAPYNHCPNVSSELFLDVCKRLIKLEKAAR